MKLSKEEMKEQRRRLHKIYMDHDVTEFRKFLEDRSKLKPELTPYITETDEVVSELMYNMKSQLMYLGPDWQEARNHLRYKQFWEFSSAYQSIEHIPLCVACKHFREAPNKDEEPCMHLGATPSDISCRAFESL